MCILRISLVHVAHFGYDSSTIRFAPVAVGLLDGSDPTLLAVTAILVATLLTRIRCHLTRNYNLHSHSRAHSLLFTPRGVTALQDFIQRTRVATRQWLLQRTDEREGGDEWGWGRLREDPEDDGVGR